MKKMHTNSIQVNNEIGFLKKVLMHYPGKEMSVVSTQKITQMNLRDIVFLDQIQQEHNYFVQQLRTAGVEVFYLEKILAQVLDANPEIKLAFIHYFLEQANLENANIRNACFQYLNKIYNNYQLVLATISGIKKDEIKVYLRDDFNETAWTTSSNIFCIDPLPNLLFLRDPAEIIYSSFNLNHMQTKSRIRENIYLFFIYKYHPMFKNTAFFNMQNYPDSMLEGGDVLVLSRSLILVGWSARTSERGIITLARSLFSRYPDLTKILAVKIPHANHTIHLDTLLTQVDYHKFLVSPILLRSLCSFLYIDREKKEQFQLELLCALRKYFSPKTKLIIVGDNINLIAEREQWNHGANCLVIKPGLVAVYNRNLVTNKLLERSGIKLIKIPSCELARGGGGPRCLTMPLLRENIIFDEK